MRKVIITHHIWIWPEKQYGPEILQLCGKMIKSKGQKCWGKLAGNLFALPPSPILNRVKNELADSRTVKTIKKEKYKFHYFIVCSEKVTCIVTIIILEDKFWNIKSAVFTYGEIENSAVDLACLQMFDITLRKIFIYVFTLFQVRTILVLTNKNQLTNQKYLHT